MGEGMVRGVRAKEKGRYRHGTIVDGGVYDTVGGDR